MRLIDGDALGDELYAMYVHASPMYKSLITKIKKMVDKAPTAKFKLNPVVHAKWEEASTFVHGFWNCTACKFCSSATAAPQLYRYCPNCGARMDGEENDA